MNKKVIINAEKRTVVTILTDKHGKYVGKAKCHPEDNFNIDLGKHISLQKAKLKRCKSAISELKYIEKEYQKSINQINVMIKERQNKVDLLQILLNKYMEDNNVK